MESRAEAACSFICAYLQQRAVGSSCKSWERRANVQERSAMAGPSKVPARHGEKGQPRSEKLRLESSHLSRSSRRTSNMLTSSPPPAKAEDCPVCFLSMPRHRDGGVSYQACCGNNICTGCLIAQSNIERRNFSCPFCRSPTASCTEEEELNKLRKRAEEGSVGSIYNLGAAYKDGNFSCLQTDDLQALTLFLRAAEMKYADAFDSLAAMAFNGKGINEDRALATRLSGIACKMGSATAHFQLGSYYFSEKWDRRKAKIHLSIAARGGDSEALGLLRNLNNFPPGCILDMEEIEKAHDEVLKAEWSEEREQAEKQLLFGSYVEGQF